MFALRNTYESTSKLFYLILLLPHKIMRYSSPHKPTSLQKHLSTHSKSPESSQVSSSARKDAHSLSNLYQEHMGRPSGYLKSHESIGFSSHGELTDRFIPSRKMLKHQHLKDEQENKPIKQQQSVGLLPQLYKRYIMLQSEKQQERGIQSYQNINLFRYAKKPFTSHNQHSIKKPPGLQFSDDLASYKHSKRKISKQPAKVLDAPALQDDYYLNLIDWSPDNFLTVGLATSVYLWNAGTAQVTRLCDLGIHNMATSVSCHPRAPIIAIGTNNGQVQLWDVEKITKVRSLLGHELRVGTMCWSSSVLTTGSRDKTIIHQDYRVSNSIVSRLTGHKQQICGLKWSFDEQQYCSGGNDNKLMVWTSHSKQPVFKFSDHKAAVKAMAWSPHQHGLLVSGGGTADRTIKFRNTLTGVTQASYDVGSQVCNLMFSRTLNEMVSTHGYSHNQINVWQVPKMQKTVTLTGHAYRVLYLAMSPDGSTIVTGAGDQTLRFWNIFPGNSIKTCSKDILDDEPCLR